MKYISGLFALNLPCKLETTGDWHTSALNWNNIRLCDSEASIFDEYGIEVGRRIPEHDEIYNVANHIRAILDLLSEKRFDLISNFRNDFICNENYTEEIFSQVKKMLPDEAINDFMMKNYGRAWRTWNGDSKPIKLEPTNRKEKILEDETVVIGGMYTQTIDDMAKLKVLAYQQRDKIRDLYDIAFLINNYYDELKRDTQRILETALEYKGLEHLDYIINTQTDELIDQSVLVDAFLRAYDKVGLLITAEERAIIQEYTLGDRDKPAEENDEEEEYCR